MYKNNERMYTIDLYNIFVKNSYGCENGKNQRISRESPQDGILTRLSGYTCNISAPQPYYMTCKKNSAIPCITYAYVYERQWCI